MHLTFKVFSCNQYRIIFNANFEVLKNSKQPHGSSWEKMQEKCKHIYFDFQIFLVQPISNNLMQISRFWKIKTSWEEKCKVFPPRWVLNQNLIIKCGTNWHKNIFAPTIGTQICRFLLSKILWYPAIRNPTIIDRRLLIDWDLFTRLSN